MTVKPTIGRVVWYHPNEHDPLAFSDQPLAALVSYVHSDTLVNLGVTDKNGSHHGRLNVLLLQDGDKAEDLPLSFGVRPNYCEWPVIQKAAPAPAPAPRKSSPNDGPTIAEWVAAGNKASKYPPSGFKSKSTQEEIDAEIEAELVAEENAKKKTKG